MTDSASSIGVQDTAPSIEDTQIPDMWRASFQGSLWLGASHRSSNPESFVATSLGSSAAATRLRSWTEARMTASRSWGSQESRWMFQAGASPLVGCDAIDSTGKNAQSSYVLREVWIRASRESQRRTSLTIGRMRIEPGAGLSAHPSLASPLSIPTNPDDEDPLERNPVGVSLEETWLERMRTTLQYFPSFSPTEITRPFASSQFQLLRLNQTFPFPRGHSLRLECGIGHIQSYGGSWEWNRDGWYLSSEAAIRNDGFTPRPAGDSSGPRITIGTTDRFCPLSSFQVQKDLPSQGLGTMRLSLEWVESSRGVSVAGSRNIARQIETMSATPSRTSAGGLARQDLANLAQAEPWIESYAHRLLLRLGSAESLRWGGGLTALLIGPTEGILLQPDVHCSLGNRVVLEGKLTSLTWARSGSLVHHIPSRTSANAGMRWSW